MKKSQYKYIELLYAFMDLCEDTIYSAENEQYLAEFGQYTLMQHINMISAFYFLRCCNIIHSYDPTFLSLSDLKTFISFNSMIMEASDDDHLENIIRAFLEVEGNHTNTLFFSQNINQRDNAYIYKDAIRDYVRDVFERSI